MRLVWILAFMGVEDVTKSLDLGLTLQGPWGLESPDAPLEILVDRGVTSVPPTNA